MVRRHWEDHRWRNIRKAILLERPVCEFCNRAPSTQVHHRKPPRFGGDPLGYDNLMAVCYPCHSTETLRLRRLLGRK